MAFKKSNFQDQEKNEEKKFESHNTWLTYVIYTLYLVVFVVIVYMIYKFLSNKKKVSPLPGVNLTSPPPPVSSIPKTKYNLGLYHGIKN